jgi:hypothetical protein
MVSEKQMAANRLNAQRSTGPRTARGKAKSSANALKHGLTAERAVVSGEDVEEYREFVQGIFDALQPQDAMEAELVGQVASFSWRLRRAARYEARLVGWVLAVREERKRELKLGDDVPSLEGDWVIAQAITEFPDFDSVDRHETHLERGYYQALNALDRRQKERREREAEERHRAQGAQN